MKKGHFLYCMCFFAVCLCPLIGMILGCKESSSENRALAEFPSMKTEAGINTYWLSQAGEYFQEHFAFRSALVTANALLQGRLLGVSTEQAVIQGSDGWLYYKDSLADYLGTEPLPERSLYNIAHTLSMTQKQLERKEIRFAFTIAPNKNSLYGDNMPYYYKYKATEKKNLKGLKKFLEQEQVNYVDLYEMFAAQPEVLYHQRDSHWNNKGAAMAADEIMTVLEKEHDSYDNETFEIRRDFVGDLDNMLYPEAPTLEDEIYYKKELTYEFVEQVSSNFAPRITTLNSEKKGSLVIYRDSFGNTLLPFMADAYEKAYFSRGVPYQFSDIDTNQADTVVIERAERFLPEMAQSPPVLEGARLLWNGKIERKAENGTRDMKMKLQGRLLQISGRILSQYLDTTSRIYLRINNEELYEAFPMDVELEEGCDAGGFCLYVNADRVLEDGIQVEVMIQDEDALQIIDSKLIKEEINK